MKENQHVKPIIADGFMSVAFEVKGHPTLTLDMSKLHPDVIRRAAAVGFAQVRIVDAAAVGMTDEEGNILSEAERIATKHERMAALIAHYESGTSEWSRVGTGTGGGKSITLEAIARVQFNGDYEKAKAEVEKFAEAKFEKDTKKALAFLRTGERVQKMIAQIKTERTPAPKVDADNALNELKGE